MERRERYDYKYSTQFYNSTSQRWNLQRPSSNKQQRACERGSSYEDIACEKVSWKFLHDNIRSIVKSIDFII